MKTQRLSEATLSDLLNVIGLREGEEYLSKEQTMLGDELYPGYLAAVLEEQISELRLLYGRLYGPNVFERLVRQRLIATRGEDTYVLPEHRVLLAEFHVAYLVGLLLDKPAIEVLEFEGYDDLVGLEGFVGFYTESNPPEDE